MARIRTIKPEFFTSEDIVEMEPLARLLYIALWCEADKEGRFAWKPKTFKIRYLPADACDIDAICDALVTRGLVVLYGAGLAVIPSFLNHQHINPREKVSNLPAPTDEELTRAPRVVNASVTGMEEGRKEGTGKEGRERNLSGQETGEMPADPDPAAGVATESTEKPAKPRKHHGSEKDHEVAHWLFEKVQKINATAKDPNWDCWANDVRLMCEVDGRTHHEIGELFAWAMRDNFWCSNILSPGKLREKWDQLTVQRARPERGAQSSGKPSAFTGISQIDHSSTDRAMAEDNARRGTKIPADGNLEF